MPCGHGGLCSGCSLDLFKSLKPCPVCRKVIQMVCEIEPKSNVGVAEVISIWEPENEEYERDEDEERDWERASIQEDEVEESGVDLEEGYEDYIGDIE